jgi:hypothetical protein
MAEINVETKATNGTLNGEQLYYKYLAIGKNLAITKTSIETLEQIKKNQSSLIDALSGSMSSYTDEKTKSSISLACSEMAKTIEEETKNFHAIMDWLAKNNLLECPIYKRRIETL